MYLDLSAFQSELRAVRTRWWTRVLIPHPPTSTSTPGPQALINHTVSVDVKPHERRKKDYQFTHASYSLVPNKPYGFCGRKALRKKKERKKDYQFTHTSYWLMEISVLSTLFFLFFFFFFFFACLFVCFCSCAPMMKSPQSSVPDHKVKVKSSESGGCISCSSPWLDESRVALTRVSRLTVR